MQLSRTLLALHKAPRFSKTNKTQFLITVPNSAKMLSLLCLLTSNSLNSANIKLT